MKLLFPVWLLTSSLFFISSVQAQAIPWQYADEIAPGAPVRAAGIVEIRDAVADVRSDLESGAISGDLEVESIMVSDPVGIRWESGISGITHNDGGGNVQIRFGNDFTSGDERFTQGGGSAFYIGGALDSPAQPLEMRVGTNASPANNDAVNWGPTFRVTTGGINTDGDIAAAGTFLWGDGKRMLQFSDTWLRLNPSGQFTTGTYNPNLLRVDGPFQVGGGGGRFLVGTNGNVGIGTTTPTERLDVQGNIKLNDRIDFDGGVDAAIEATRVGTVDTIIVSANDNVELETAGTTKVSVTASGNVGIGTTSPAQRLEVMGKVKVTAPNPEIILTNEAWTGTGPNASIGMIGGGLSLSGKSPNADWPQLFVAQGGNVGIGNTSPNADLHISRTEDAVIRLEADTDNVTESDNPRIDFAQDGGSVVGRIGFANNTNSLELVNQFNEHLSFGTNNAYRMRILNNGNVGIGTTSPAQRLHVVGNSYLQGTLFLGSGDTALFRDAANRIATDDQFYVRAGSANTYLYSTNTYLGAGSGDTTHLRGNTFRWNDGIITPSGNVGIGTTSPENKLTVQGGNYTPLNVSSTNTAGVGGGGIAIHPDNWALRTELSVRDNGDFRIWRGVDRFVIHRSNGNIGIGREPSGNKLHVNGTVAATNFVGNGAGLTGISGDNMGNHVATTNLNVNDREIRNIRALQGKDWDDNTGGADNKYRLLYRDGAHMFYDGGVAIGGYGNGTWTDLQSGRLIVQDRVGIGTTNPGTNLEIDSASPTIRLRNNGNRIWNIENNSIGTFSVGRGHGGGFGTGGKVILVDEDGKMGFHTTPSPEALVNMSTNTNWVSQNSTAYNLSSVIRVENTSLSATAAPAARFVTTAVNSPIITADYNNSEVFRVQSNGNVGIGTSSPSQRLHVAGNIRMDGNRLYFGGGNTGDFLNYATQQGLTYHENGGAQWRLTGNGNNFINGGNVGIGTTTPAERLHVVGNARVDGAITAPEGTLRDNGGGWVRTYGNTGWYSQTYGGGWFMQDTTWLRNYGNKDLYMGTAIIRTDGELQAGNGGSRFVVKTNGRVGIGTTSPSTNLHVTGGEVRIDNPVNATHNPSGWDTHFNYQNTGRNLVRGTTEVRGNFNVDGNVSLGDQLDIGSGSTSWDFLNWDGDGKELRMHYGDTNNQLRFGRYAANFGAWEANPVLFDMDAPNSSLVVTNDGGIEMGSGLDVAGTIRTNARNIQFGGGAQRIYGDNGSALYIDNNNSTTSQLIVRDREDLSYGRLYGGGNGAEFGLMDRDGQWTVRAVRDSHVELRDNNEATFRAGQGGVSGNYGTVQTIGTGKGGWEGFSINGNEVFMNNAPNQQVGLYNDATNRWRIWWDQDDFNIRHTNNELIMSADQNERTILYNNGAWKARTESDGFQVEGKVRADNFCDGGGNNCTPANRLKTRCDNLDFAQLELTGAERPDGNRWMVMPEDVSKRCEQKGYDFGFTRSRFAPRNGTSGWCGYGNARTAFFDERGMTWRSTSVIGLGSCANGSVRQARCCHIN